MLKLSSYFISFNHILLSASKNKFLWIHVTSKQQKKNRKKLNVISWKRRTRQELGERKSSRWNNRRDHKSEMHERERERMRARNDIPRVFHFSSCTVHTQKITHRHTTYKQTDCWTTTQIASHNPHRLTNFRVPALKMWKQIVRIVVRSFV